MHYVLAINARDVCRIFMFVPCINDD